MSDCFYRKGEKKEATSNIFVSSKSNWFSTPNRISLASTSGKVPINILRNAGTIQSLLLKIVVSTSTCEIVITQGIKRRCVNIPLQKVNLVSDLVNWFCCGGYQAYLAY